MRVSRRSAVAIGVFVLLGFVVAARHLVSKQRRRRRSSPPAARVVNVTNGGDRGPGTLREALFIAAAAASGSATISIKVADDHSRDRAAAAREPARRQRRCAAGRHADRRPRIWRRARYLTLPAPTPRSRACTSAIARVPRSCCARCAFACATRPSSPAMWASRSAENASDTLIEDNHFTKNKIAVRFAAAGSQHRVDKNEFSKDKDAALWAVRSGADSRGDPINVHDNHFNDEHTGIVAGNIPILVERNEFFNSQEAAVHLVGAGAVHPRQPHQRRRRRWASSSRMSTARSSTTTRSTASPPTASWCAAPANTLVRGNRVHNCGYGLAFVLGDRARARARRWRTPSSSRNSTASMSSATRRSCAEIRCCARTRWRCTLTDFTPPGGPEGARRKPFLDNNTFDKGGWTPAAAGAAPPPPAAPSPPRAQ